MATRQNIVNPQAHVQVKKHYPTSGAATVTLAADADNFHAISRIDWSYAAAPTNGRLTVVAGTTTLLDIDITSGGHGYYDLKFPDLLHNDFTKNEQVVITLASASVVGKLTVRHI